jgi:hypothetical protein
MPELETIPQKWNRKTNWVPKLDCEQNEESDWKYWSWDCEEEEEEIIMGESSEGEEESLGEDLGEEVVRCEEE